MNFITWNYLLIPYLVNTETAGVTDVGNGASSTTGNPGRTAMFH